MLRTEAAALASVTGPPVASGSDRADPNSEFYHYTRLRGIWPISVSGWDPRKEPEKFHPYMPIKNIDADYPPTLLIAGLKDTDVPHEESEKMAAELKKHRVEHRLILIPDAEHGLEGGDPKLVAAAYQEAVAFILDHLGNSGRKK